MTGKTKTTGESLFGVLEERILSGEMGEGERLPSERALAKDFGVSRPVVREALRRLAERSLVEVLPGSGAYVREARLYDAARPMGLLLRRRRATPRSLVEARKMLECEAAVLAADRATTDDLRIMERSLARFDAARDIIEKTRFDILFHTSIIRASHNPVLETMFAAIAEMVAEMMMRSLGDPAVCREGIPYHGEILQAIKGRDPVSARQAVEGHLLVAGQLYGEDYDLSLDSLARRELCRFLGPKAGLEDLMRETVAGGGEGDGATEEP